MTRVSGPQLPARVMLPSERLIASWHLRHALKASKQVLHLWRQKHAFPPFHRDGADSFTDTNAVRQWLEARGTRVMIGD